MIRLLCAAFVGAAAVVSAAPGAIAQYYVSGNFGAILIDDGDTQLQAAGPGASGEITVRPEFKAGLGATGAVGRAFGNGRTELEISYRSADVDRISGSGSVTVGGVAKTFPASLSDTDLTALAFMLNVWYDFDTGTSWRPFAGAGIGAARVNLHIGRTDTGFASDFDHTDTVAAFQVGFGIGYEITPQVRADLSYRYFMTSNPSLATTIAGANVSVKPEIDIHNLFAGLMVKF